MWRVIKPLVWVIITHSPLADRRHPPLPVTVRAMPCHPEDEHDWFEARTSKNLCFGVIYDYSVELGMLESSR